MSTPSLAISLLPAAHGDGIWVEYTTGGVTRRIVIDGGPINAYDDFVASFSRLPRGDKRVELFVVTHVDTDHIEAPVRLLAQRFARWPFSARDIWFNGYRHMIETRGLGARDGEFLGALLDRDAPNEWNRAFKGHAVVVAPGGKPPQVTLAGGMTLTILSPDVATLETMARKWKKQLTAFDPGDLDRALEELAADRRYKRSRVLGPDDLAARLLAQLNGVDSSAANGSSIAFLAEFRGKSCLLLADAHMKTVCASIRALLPRGASHLRVDAVKVSHHGSKKNLTQEFLRLVEADHFLISTNGDRHDHPDAVTIEAIIKGSRRPPTIWFNYRSKFTRGFEAGSKKPGAKYATRYPERGQAGITLTL